MGVLADMCVKFSFTVVDGGLSRVFCVHGQGVQRCPSAAVDILLARFRNDKRSTISYQGNQFTLIYNKENLFSIKNTARLSSRLSYVDYLL